MFNPCDSEYTGLGLGPTEQLERLPVTKFKPNVNEKLKAYDHLKLKMEAEELSLPANHLKLLTELKMFQFQVTPSGKIILHHVGSGSDDFADSLCYAVYGLSKEKKFVYVGMKGASYTRARRWR